MTQEIDIKKIFKKHWEYYSSQGAETLKQQSGQIEQVSGDYQGRVLYELLQNAFDKAKDKIFVKVYDKYLYVSNNGEPFTFTQNYDYEHGKTSRGDFQSLCSISTSTKNATNSIGNKGVGFKSVYSINNYADIFTKQDQNKKKWIGFRVYDEIKKDDLETFRNCNESIEVQLASVQQEYKHRGIPGFYYPILLNEEIENFDNYVTVIRVKHNNKIQELIEEIKKIHFYFVSLKYEKNISVKIQIDNENIEKNINTHGLVKYNLNNLTELIDKTSNKTDNPQVALFYKKDKKYDDLIYNYMPTKVVSPFLNIDFQGDFQSTVDRKGIDLDKGDIAEYNKALLQGCIELHFLSLSTYLDDGYELNLKYIDKYNIPKTELVKDGFWKYMQLNNDSEAKKQTIEIVKNIFESEDDEDKTFSNFFSFLIDLAEKYFIQEQISLENVNDFWRVIFYYFDIWRKDNGSSIFALYWIRERFYNKILKKLCSQEVKCLPITVKNQTSDIEELKELKTFNDYTFYKKDNNNLDIPSTMNISLTQYNFLGRVEELAGSLEFKELKFKNFTNYNEILKHFRQISKDGDPSKETISEVTQCKILNSIYKIYLAKQESNFLTTHRYTEILAEKTNPDYTKIAADFAISTIFLKIKDKKLYKPAQFCYIDEVDLEFIKFEISQKSKDENVDDFLKFLGVSFDKNIRYIDFEKNNFFKGLDYIPSLIIDAQDKKDGGKKVQYIPNMKIWYKENIQHPALFYKTTNYNGILQDIQSTDKESLNIVVKKLEDYPKGYIEELSIFLKGCENINKKQQIVFKIYQEIFKKYSEEFLIFKAESKSFEWIKKLEENKHFIAKTKEDFELLKGKVDILAAYSDLSNDENLKQYQTKISFTIDKDGIDDNNIKYQIDRLMPYILLSITKAENNDSKKNFLDDEKDELNDYFGKWQELKFKQLESIKPIIKISNREIDSSEIDKPILINQAIYYKNENSLDDFSYVLGEFFNVGKLKTNIENILLKGEDKSKIMFDINDIDSMVSKWIKIDDTTKQDILSSLKKIGFKDDIGFKLKYSKSDLTDLRDNSKIETEQDIQNEINKIKKNINIIFECSNENKQLIDEMLTKYKAIELQLDNNIREELSQIIFLQPEDIYAKLCKSKEELDNEIKKHGEENLVEDYMLLEIPEVYSIDEKKVEKNERTTNVDNFFDDKHSSRNIKIAQNRGLKIEEIIVDKLSQRFKLTDLIEHIKQLFEAIKIETLSDNKTNRFTLRNKNKYEELLASKNTNLSELLHISKTLGDGLGFDILYPIEEEGELKILKVEVKSSSTGKTIYLSENERKQILLSKNDENFKLYLYIKNEKNLENKPLDITDSVRAILETNQFSNITAETWIISL